MRKNVTLSAEANLIERARRRASREKRSLNVAFREWLARYAGRESAANHDRKLMDEVGDASPGGRRFTRDELNER